MAFQEACVQFLEILCHVLQQLESLLFAVQMKPCLYHSSRSEGRRPERIHCPTAIHARTQRDKLRCVGLRPRREGATLLFSIVLLDRLITASVTSRSNERALRFACSGISVGTSLKEGQKRSRRLISTAYIAFVC